MIEEIAFIWILKHILLPTLKILLYSEVFWTVLSGTSVFVLSQVFLRFLLEPWQQQSKTEGKIVNALLQYENIYAQPSPITEENKSVNQIQLEMADYFKKLSCELAENARANHYLKGKENYHKLQKLLISIANHAFSNDTHEDGK